MADRPYRILVTGSRDWDDVTTIGAAIEQAVIDSGAAALLVVHGACPSGTDRHADHYTRWMRGKGVAIDVERHPADWASHGKAAGPIRNAAMIRSGADVCLAFIRNGSRGASHTVTLARRAGIPVQLWTAP